MSQESGRAMLHADGAVWLDGNAAPASSAIFDHSLIQTQKGNARLDVDGSTATIDPETVVQFEGDELLLDHGTLHLSTQRKLRVRVNCLTITPVLGEWTRYDVTDVDGRVTISALTDDVEVHHKASVNKKAQATESLHAVVRQGEQSTRDEHCGGAIKPADTVDADAAYLNTWWAKGAAIGALVFVTCYALCRGDDPVSPYKPN
ncbi:MAG TPA: hypothetical protein VND65_06130 [Candidatus Binatia bacterium]|nr:hypothetical protein [Candidatus Binatia bacterium]